MCYLPKVDNANKAIFTADDSTRRQVVLFYRALKLLRTGERDFSMMCLFVVCLFGPFL